MTCTRKTMEVPMRKHAVKKARSMFRLFVLKVAEVENKWNEVVL